MSEWPLALPIDEASPVVGIVIAAFMRITLGPTLARDPEKIVRKQEASAHF